MEAVKLELEVLLSPSLSFFINVPVLLCSCSQKSMLNLQRVTKMYNNDPTNQVSHTQSSHANITEASPSALSLTTTTTTIALATTSQPQESYVFANHLASLGDRIGSLCKSNTFADVIFIVGPTKDVYRAHKLILAISSPVFAAMFYGPMSEADKEIVLPDCKSIAFDCLLEFAYKNELKVTDAQLALDTLYAARKYSMRLLEDECLLFLSRNVCHESVLAIGEAAEKYSLPALESICKQFIQDNAYQVLRTHYAYLSLEAIGEFTENDQLNIQEIQLFEILQEWATQECKRLSLEPNGQNKRRVLEPVLPHVRFPTMSAAEVADQVVPSGVLNTEELARVLTFISATDKDPSAVPFPTESRNLRPTLPKTPTVLLDLQQQDSSVTGRMARHRSRKRSRNR